MRKSSLLAITVFSFTIMSCSSGGGSSGDDPIPYSLGLTMISVPAGTFQRDGVATNTSTISSFRMSAYEITRAQFQEIMGTDPSDTDYSNGSSDPVQTVNWYHAIAFCNKLSIAEGLEPVYAVYGVDFDTLTYADIPISGHSRWNETTAYWGNNGYRLPTEMEWMWAAMGATNDRTFGYTGTGTNTMGYRKGYAGSTEGATQTNIGNYAWTDSNSDNKTHTVGIKYPNELGIYDMSGNVWEWCWDWYDEYPSGTRTDYRGPSPNVSRVIRGGSWYYVSSYYTVADRDLHNPGSRYNNCGFRVVRP